jgi:hypothetical protein
MQLMTKRSLYLIKIFIFLQKNFYFIEFYADLLDVQIRRKEKDWSNEDLNTDFLHQKPWLTAY